MTIDWLSVAVKHALKNPIQSIGRNSISRFGAVLTDGKSTFFGWNSYTTHPLQARFGSNSKSVHTHCEIDTIIQAIRSKARLQGVRYSDVCDLSGYSMYVARVLKSGTTALGRPCVGCQSALVAFNITEVQWTI